MLKVNNYFLFLVDVNLSSNIIKKMPYSKVNNNSNLIDIGHVTNETNFKNPDFINDEKIDNINHNNKINIIDKNKENINFKEKNKIKKDNSNKLNNPKENDDFKNKK